MIATLVHVWVQPGRVEEFIEACRINHLQSIKENGNFRFDILRDSIETNKFTLYEAYATEEDAKAHKETQHYLNWRELVAEWMVKPRQGVKHDILFPEKWIKE